MAVKQGRKPQKPEMKPLKAEGKPSRPQTARFVDRDDDDLEMRDLGDDFQLAEPTSAPPDAKPNPVELPAPINPEGGRKQSVETHRNLFCVHYDSCLDEAVKRGWNSFTCIRCSFYRQTEAEGGGVERFATQRKLS